MTLGGALLTPTRLYVKSCLRAIRETGAVKGLAHITGGGFTDNIPRVLPKHLGVGIDLARLPVLPVFKWLAEQGGIAELELLRTFNCGIGMIAIVKPDAVEQVSEILTASGETVALLGEVIPAAGEHRVVYNGHLDLRGAMKRRVAILISGRGSNMAALIEAARRSRLSRRDRRRDLQPRRRRRSRESVGQRHSDGGHRKQAVRQGPRGVRGGAAAGARRASNVELICLGGFMRLFTAEFVQRWYGKMLNIHPSLLPSFPGLDPHGQALHAGVKISGATVHFVIPETDAGPIVMQGAFAVRDDDTPETLAARVIQIEHRIYPEALRLLASGKIHAGRRSLQDVRNRRIGRQPDLTPRARGRRNRKEIPRGEPGVKS